MSYILNALKRAEHERQRGQLPDPLATTGPTLVEHRQRSWRSSAGPWMGMAGVVAGALAMGWFLGSGRGGPAAGGAGVQASHASQAAQGLQVTQGALATPPTQGDQVGQGLGSSASAMAPPIQPTRAMRPQAVAPAAAPPAPTVDPSPARAPAQAGRTAAVGLAASMPLPVNDAGRAASSPARSAAASVATPAQRPLAWRALPEDIRRQLPALKVGGSMYSAQPASRLLVIDGQAVREGDRLGPDLVLEHIGPHAAVLRLREQRFEITY